MVGFDEFFGALWRDENWPKPQPFPWQAMLADRAAKADWPRCIDLPTASGKTGSLDVAIYGLATTANAPERMPRRIWFVVDRRIVVDEAFERAKKIAKKLRDAKDGPLFEIGERLKNLSGTKWPLAVARLRGGVWRDEGWALNPSQPAIICSTVDQVGSALLFRAYGHSDNTASIYAGLAAHDSLILLDEAHCAVPCMQTLQAISYFRSNTWATQPLKSPFHFSVMSATPPEEIPEKETFPSVADRTHALNHPLLLQRHNATKPTQLQSVRSGKFIEGVCSAAQEFLGKGARRVGVMVNRVAAAESIAGLLRVTLDWADVVLLTGRMRPLDRDALVERWEPLLKAGSAQAIAKPIVLVTTQCLEVGADFDFDALVSECASLDALRQRFGRLDRLGKIGCSRGVILIREEHTREAKDKHIDPIYGNSIYETWKWLNEPEQLSSEAVVDFGVNALNARINPLRESDLARFQRMLAPTAEAPILLPAHLDLLCQTAPRPVPEPDISLFLHGKDRGAAEARVVFRGDLTTEPGDTWIDILSLVSPSGPEMLTVPLYRLLFWLAEEQVDEISGDVLGVPERVDDERSSPRRSAHPFVLWRGQNRSKVTRDLGSIRPNDIVVLAPNAKGLKGLGQEIDKPNGFGAHGLDLAERALREAHGRVVLRLQSDVLQPLRGIGPVDSIIELSANSDVENDEIEAALQSISDMATLDMAEANATTALLDWLKQTIRELLEDRFEVKIHPAGGRIITGRKRRILHIAEAEDDIFADEDDLRSKSYKEIPLRLHTADVRREAVDSAMRCLGSEFTAPVSVAAAGHDLGKLDWRFQVLLRGGDEVEVASGCDPLAKSAKLPEGRRRRNQITEEARLPKKFRHEFLSMQLVEHLGFVNTIDEPTKDLVLHLIASHHGHGRPFAPVVMDDNLRDVSLSPIGLNAVLTAADRKELRPAHGLDSGVSDRFWRLTRRFGWWGLAYLESIFRLADWRASALREAQAELPHETADFPLRISQVTRNPKPSEYEEIPFDALDGANPLAFLAALGTFRLLSKIFPEHEFRLNWQQRFGAWRPVLWTSKTLDISAMINALERNGLQLDTMFTGELLAATKAAGPKNKRGEAGWEDKLKFPSRAFRKFCKSASASPSTLTEFAAAWASEMGTAEDRRTEIARRTRFDFTAGPQSFIGMLRELRATCTVRDLRRSLFTGWHYSPAGVSMRWDTQDEKRQYALQAVDPTNGSKNPPLADRGANFLAVEALPFFPLVPDRLASQPGFDSSDEGRSWSWPIWSSPITVDTLRSLLTIPFASADDLQVVDRRALGTLTVFKSAIVQPSGRYRCFTPAKSL